MTTHDLFCAAFALLPDDGEGERILVLFKLFMCGGCLVGGRIENGAEIAEACIADFLLPVQAISWLTAPDFLPDVEVFSSVLYDFFNHKINFTCLKLCKM